MARSATMQAWIDALRQPERRQAEGALQNGSSQCCLGVMCEVLQARGELPKSVKWKVDGDGNGKLTANHRLVTTDKAGMPDQEYSAPKPGHFVAESMPFDIIDKRAGITVEQAHALAGMNDSGKSFEEIACQLEEWFPTPRDLWVKALRSGEYTQGLGRLLDDRGHCCLGVACDALSKAGELPDAHVWNNGVLRHGDGHYSTAMLPAAMLDVLGLTDPQQDMLATENDTKRTPFTLIADLLDTWAAR